MRAQRETSKSRSDAPGRAQGDTRVNAGASLCPYIDKSWPVCTNGGRGTVGLAPAGHNALVIFHVTCFNRPRRWGKGRPWVGRPRRPGESPTPPTARGAAPVSPFPTLIQGSRSLLGCSVPARAHLGGGCSGTEPRSATGKEGCELTQQTVDLPGQDGLRKCRAELWSPSLRSQRSLASPRTRCRASPRSRDLLRSRKHLPKPGTDGATRDRPGQVVQHELLESWRQGRYHQTPKSLPRLQLWSRLAICRKDTRKDTCPQHPQ